MDYEIINNDVFRFLPIYSFPANAITHQCFEEIMDIIWRDINDKQKAEIIDTLKTFGVITQNSIND